MNIMLNILVDEIKIMGIDLIDFPSLTELIIRFSLNLLAILLLVRWLYYSVTKRKDYLFTFILISTVIFLLCFLLESVKLQIGFALGLFAIFGIIRYRTDTMPIKEMTYLFLVIGISVINALANKKTSYTEVIFTNIIIISIAYCLEKVWLLKHESRKTIIYEKINLIRNENRQLLLDDLKERTGIEKINRIEIGKIDFLRDVCSIKIYYEESGNLINLTDQADEIRTDDYDD